jgi:hypothetical protein
MRSALQEIWQGSRLSMPFPLNRAVAAVVAAAEPRARVVRVWSRLALSVRGRGCPFRTRVTGYTKWTATEKGVLLSNERLARQHDYAVSSICVCGDGDRLADFSERIHRTRDRGIALHPR